MATLLDQGFSISTLTATGGAGKSYITTHDLALNRLVAYNYGLVTNLPLRVDELSEFVAEQRGCKPEEVRSRIVIIPEEKLSRWREGNGGPWEYADYFKEHSCDLIIDEAHEYCKKGAQDEEWRTFLGEARHPPYQLQRVQFLTQSVKKVAVPIDQHAALRYRLEKGDMRRGWLGFAMGDFYQMLASFTGRYTPIVYRIEEVKDASEKWKQNAEDAFLFRSDVQALYDTHSEAGGKSVAKTTVLQKLEYQRRPRFIPAKFDYFDNGKPVWTSPTWLWAMTRNPAAMGKILIAVAVYAFFVGGGVPWATAQTMKVVRQVTDQASTSIQTNKSTTLGTGSESDGDSNGEEKPCGCQKTLAEKNELTRKVKELVEEINSSGALGAISPRYVQFRGGVITDLHGVVTDGAYEGQTVEQIDFNGRRAFLSDTGWVRLGKKPEKTADPELQRSLPSAEGDDGSGSGSRSGE